jgi:hypothetical protein
MNEKTASIVIQYFCNFGNMKSINFAPTLDKCVC